MNDLAMIYDLVKQTNEDVKEIKERQSEIAQKLAINDELHKNCDGKKAIEMLNTKGAKTLFYYVNNYKQGIAVIIGSILIAVVTSVGIVKVFKVGKDEIIYRMTK